jgi:hypothetical protein
MRTVEERRRHRRVPWSAGVRGLTKSGAEFHARTIEIGASGLSLRTRRRLTPGDSVSLHLEEVGTVNAEVAWRLNETDYTLIFRTSPDDQGRIADQLTWLINRDGLNLEEERSDPRRTSPTTVSAVFGEGVATTCTVLDLSVFGIALSTSGPRPDLGQPVHVGERIGECIRHLNTGFAVSFRNARLPGRP